MILFFRKLSKTDRDLGYGKYDAGFPAEGECPAAKRKSFRENYFAGEFAYTGILLYTYFIKRPF